MSNIIVCLILNLSEITVDLQTHPLRHKLLIYDARLGEDKIKDNRNRNTNIATLDSQFDAAPLCQSASPLFCKYRRKNQ